MLVYNDTFNSVRILKNYAGYQVFVGAFCISDRTTLTECLVDLKTRKFTGIFQSDAEKAKEGIRKYVRITKENN